MIRSGFRKLASGGNAAQQMITRVDLFGKSVPNFSLNGETEVRTCAGACATVFIGLLTLSMALFRLQSTLEKDEVRTRTYMIENNFGQTDTFDTGADNFMLAVALIDRESGQPLNDQRFVKWAARYSEESEGTQIVQRLEDLHPCTDDDFMRLAKAEKRSARSIEKLRSTGGLYCINWSDVDVGLFGDRHENSFSSFELLALPCSQKESVFGGESDSVRNDCNFDRFAALDYLQNSSLITVYNEQKLQIDQFGAHQVIDQAVLKTLKFDAAHPHSFPTSVRKTRFADRTSHFYFGPSTDQEYFQIKVEEPEQSELKTWPTASNAGSFQFCSLALHFDQDLTVIERTSESMVELLAQVGGLLYLLVMLGHLFVWPFNSFALKSELLKSAFYHEVDKPAIETTDRDEKSDQEGQQDESELQQLNQNQSADEKLAAQINQDFHKKGLSRIQELACCSCLLQFCRRQTKQGRQLRKAMKKVKRELSLVDFIEQKSKQAFTMLATLTTRQVYIVDRMSKQVLDSETESDDDDYRKLVEAEFQPLIQDQTLSSSIGQSLISSNDTQDQRLVRLYSFKLKFAEQKSLRRYKKLRAKQGPLPVRSNFVNDAFMKEMTTKQMASVPQNPVNSGIQLDILSGEPTPKAFAQANFSHQKLQPGLMNADNSIEEEKTVRTDENSVSHTNVADDAKQSQGAKPSVSRGPSGILIQEQNEEIEFDQSDSAFYKLNEVFN